MQSLGDTTAMLARVRKQVEAFAAGADQHGPAVMQETAEFGSNPGALRMLSYVPEDLPAGSPLVVVLHGCTQRAEAHAFSGGWLTLADRYGFAVLAPEQSPSNNPNRCFNWYQPDDAARGGGEAASIRAMVSHMLAEHALDARRVFATGLSAGGAMTAVMLATYPDVFAAGGVVAGLPYGVADNVQEALSAMYADSGRSGSDLAERVRRAAPAGGSAPRLSIWHGDADSTVRPHNAVHLANQWAAVHGLTPEPSETQRLPGRTRMVWRSPAGEALVESNLVQGLAHGTPLATAGPEGVGSAGPYMLEAGVSSSLEIARFWGLAPAAEARAEPSDRPAQRAKAHGQPDAASAIGDQVMASVSGHVPAGVKSVIEQALKTAGLMK